MGYISDLIESYKKKRLWMHMAMVDLKIRFQGTTLGVFWILFTFLLRIIVLSIIFSMVLDKPLKDYLLYLAAGLVSWQFISASITGGSQTFEKAKPLLEQMPLPLSIFAYQMISRETILYLLHFLILIPLMVIFQDNNFLIQSVLLAFVGVLILLIHMLLLATWVGWLTARFRDLKHLIVSIISISFLITPILWPPPEKYADHIFIILNPFTHMLGIVRDPLIHGVMPMDSLAIVGGMTLIHLLICMMSYKPVRKKLILWL